MDSSYIVDFQCNPTTLPYKRLTPWITIPTNCAMVNEDWNGDSRCEIRGLDLLIYCYLGSFCMFTLQGSDARSEPLSTASLDEATPILHV